MEDSSTTSRDPVTSASISGVIEAIGSDRDRDEVQTRPLRTKSPELNASDKYLLQHPFRWTRILAFGIVLEERLFGTKSILNATKPAEGKQRIAWTCRCGQEISDEFVELVEGAAERHRLNLQSRVDEHLRSDADSIRRADEAKLDQSIVLLQRTFTSIQVLTWLTLGAYILRGECYTSKFEEVVHWTLKVTGWAVLGLRLPTMSNFFPTSSRRLGMDLFIEAFAASKKLWIKSLIVQTCAWAALGLHVLILHGSLLTPDENSKWSIFVAEPFLFFFSLQCVAWMAFVIVPRYRLDYISPCFFTVPYKMELLLKLDRRPSVKDFMEDQLCTGAILTFMAVSTLQSVYGFLMLIPLICADLSRSKQRDLLARRNVYGHATQLFRSALQKLYNLQDVVDYTAQLFRRTLGFGHRNTSSQDLESQDTNSRRVDPEIATTPQVNQCLTHLAPLFLLLCHNEGRYATRLLQLDLVKLQATSDKALFKILRNNYKSMREEWWYWCSLRTISWIKFVHFEMYRSELVDVRKTDAMPPPDHADYSYWPAPPDLIPPIGDKHMMHLFQHPECAEDEALCMFRFPKKLKEKLQCSGGASPGWGLHFVEGWHLRKICIILFTLFGLGSLLIGILWARYEHSIQDAFAIASYMIGFAGVSLGTLQAVLLL